MTGYPSTKQRLMAMSSAALAGPVMRIELDPMSVDANGSATPWAGGITATSGFTAKCFARHLGRPST